jgi:lysophospholipase L1-like esterase
MKRFFLTVLYCGILFFLIRMFLPQAPSVRNPSPAGENIICFGDSLTSGIGASQGMDYPAQLSRMISLPVVNAGRPGDTTADALARLEDDVLSRSPRIVLITLGGNDFKNRLPRNAAFDNLRQIVGKIQDQGALVVIGGIKIPLWGADLEKAYKELARETGSLIVSNIYKDVFGNSSRMSDPIHPNDEGYRIIADRFREAVSPYL